MTWPALVMSPVDGWSTDLTTLRESPGEYVSSLCEPVASAFTFFGDWPVATAVFVMDFWSTSPCTVVYCAVQSTAAPGARVSVGHTTLDSLEWPSNLASSIEMACMVTLPALVTRKL